MQVIFAHHKIPVLDKEIEIAVFMEGSSDFADEENAEILSILTESAREVLKLRIDKAALYFEKDGENQFYGDAWLVNYVVQNGIPAMTHQIEI